MNTEHPLKNKVAVITGAGRRRGIGAGIAQGLAAAGARVVISDIGEPDDLLPADKIGTNDEMQQVAKAIQTDDSLVETIACDVRDESQVASLFDETRRRFGRVDILVNNAGVGYLIKPLVDVPAEEWRTVIDINLTGAFLCSKHAARAMIEQGDGGRIINIASQGAKSGFPHLAAYIASKHGMIGLTRSNAVELGGHGITVNAVCPNHITTGLGAVQNEYFAEFTGKSVSQYLDDMAQRIPMGRPGLVTDIANAVVFLCRDESAYITGEAMNVSGGEEMH